MTAPPMPTEAEAMDRNLDLAHTLLRELLGDPEAVAIPDDATIILVPDDDPALMHHNLAMALDTFMTGQNVYLRHMITAPPADEQPAEDERRTA